jgi:hypothetical protein
MMELIEKSLKLEMSATGHLASMPLSRISKTMAIKHSTLNQQARQSHRESMRRTLLERMEAAKKQGNQVLLVKLEAEQKALGLW